MLQNMGKINNEFIKQFKVMIVNDEVGQLMILSHIISTILGVSVDNIVKVFDGSEAVDLAERNHFDLILMDLHMPIMDGYKASLRIKSNLECEMLPTVIVGISAHVDDEVQAKCRSHLMDFCTASPLDLEWLKSDVIMPLI